MNIRKLILTSAVLLAASPAFASTFFGGYEDTTNGDHDYNDIVFSVSGTNLNLITADGAWYAKPVVNNDANPFWDNQSLDGAKMNIGYCIYGGGSCGTALSPNAQFLASSRSTKLAADSVYFSASGPVATNIILKIAAQNDVLGWFDSTGKYGYINPTGSTGTFYFTPDGDFALFGTTYQGVNKYGINQYNASAYSSLNPSDYADPSHFAFFTATSTPEPGTLSVMAISLMALGTIARRRIAR